MPEVPRAGEHHGEAGGVRGLDDLVVAHRAAGLDHRRGAGLGGSEEAVGEREEGVGGHHRAPGQRLRLARRFGGVRRLEGGDAGAVHPAHLAGADAHRGAVPGVDDGVGLHVLGHLEGELEVGQLACGVGARVVTTFSSHVLHHGVVARLHEEAAGQRAERQPLGARIGQAAGGEKAQALLLGEDRLGLGRRVGGDDDLGEDGGDLARGLRVDGAVQAMMPPKGLTGSQRNALA